MVCGLAQALELSESTNNIEQHRIIMNNQYQDHRKPRPIQVSQSVQRLSSLRVTCEISVRSCEHFQRYDRQQVIYIYIIIYKALERQLEMASCWAGNDFSLAASFARSCHQDHSPFTESCNELKPHEHHKLIIKIYQNSHQSRLHKP